MNSKGVSMLRVLVTLALVLGVVITAVAGQLWLAIPFAIFAAIVGAAAVFSRAKTPTD